MKRVLRPFLLCLSVTLPALAPTKYLLIDGSILADLPRSFIDWLVAAYNPQNAEEVADMELVVALAISFAAMSALACLAALLQQWRSTRKF